MVVSLNMVPLKVFKLTLIPALLLLLGVGSKFKMINPSKKKTLSYVRITPSETGATIK